MTDGGAAAASVNRRKRALGVVLRLELDKKKRANNDDDVIVPTDLIKDKSRPNQRRAAYDSDHVRDTRGNP